MRLRLSFLSFLLLIALVETGLAATQVTMMEPRKYARTPGPPNRFVSTFQAAPGTGKLTVINGESDGRNRISSAVIQLNGNQVFGPRSFNQNQSEITGNVQLLESNSLSVELASGPGGFRARAASSPAVNLPRVKIS